MRAILIRNLRRSFRIAPEWSRTLLAALHTNPEIEGAPCSQPENIVVEPHGSHFRMLTPDGIARAGTLRDLAARIDVGIMQQGFRAEADQFLLLPAAILRGPSEERSAFIGGCASGKTWLSLSLLEIGWKFEGDGWAVIHDTGVTPLPRTLRVRSIPPHLSASFSDTLKGSPSLRFDPRVESRAVDPRKLQGDWRLGSGPIKNIFFLELNVGGCTDLRALGEAEAFGRTLALCRGHLEARSLIALRSATSIARPFRLRLGAPGQAAVLLSKLIDV